MPELGPNFHIDENRDGFVDAREVRRLAELAASPDAYGKIADALKQDREFVGLAKEMASVMEHMDASVPANAEFLASLTPEGRESLRALWDFANTGKDMAKEAAADGAPELPPGFLEPLPRPESQADMDKLSAHAEKLAKESPAAALSALRACAASCPVPEFAAALSAKADGFAAKEAARFSALRPDAFSPKDVHEAAVLAAEPAVRSALAKVFPDAQAVFAHVPGEAAKRTDAFLANALDGRKPTENPAKAFAEVSRRDSALFRDRLALCAALGHDPAPQAAGFARVREAQSAMLVGFGACLKGPDGSWRLEDPADPSFGDSASRLDVTGGVAEFGEDGLGEAVAQIPEILAGKRPSERLDWLRKVHASMDAKLSWGDARRKEWTEYTRAAHRWCLRTAETDLRAWKEATPAPERSVAAQSPDPDKNPLAFLRGVAKVARGLDVGFVDSDVRDPDLAEAAYARLFFEEGGAMPQIVEARKAKGEYVDARYFDSLCAERKPEEVVAEFRSAAFDLALREIERMDGPDLSFTRAEAEARRDSQYARARALSAASEARIGAQKLEARVSGRPYVGLGLEDMAAVSMMARVSSYAKRADIEESARPMADAFSKAAKDAQSVIAAIPGNLQAAMRDNGAVAYEKAGWSTTGHIPDYVGGRYRSADAGALGLTGEAAKDWGSWTNLTGLETGLDDAKYKEWQDAGKTGAVVAGSIAATFATAGALAPYFGASYLGMAAYGASVGVLSNLSNTALDVAIRGKGWDSGTEMAKDMLSDAAVSAALGAAFGGGSMRMAAFAEAKGWSPAARNALAGWTEVTAFAAGATAEYGRQRYLGEDPKAQDLALNALAMFAATKGAERAFHATRAKASGHAAPVDAVRAARDARSAARDGWLPIPAVERRLAASYPPDGEPKPLNVAGNACLLTAERAEGGIVVYSLSSAVAAGENGVPVLYVDLGPVFTKLRATDAARAIAALERGETPAAGGQSARAGESAAESAAQEAGEDAAMARRGVPHERGEAEDGPHGKREKAKSEADAWSAKNYGKLAEELRAMKLQDVLAEKAGGTELGARFEGVARAFCRMDKFPKPGQDAAAFLEKNLGQDDRHNVALLSWNVIERFAKERDIDAKAPKVQSMIREVWQAKNKEFFEALGQKYGIIAEGKDRISTIVGGKFGDPETVDRMLEPFMEKLIGNTNSINNAQGL